MSWLAGMAAPWLGWAFTGVLALLAVVFGAARAAGRYDGLQEAEARQTEAQVKARDTVDAVKEDVRAIPPSPAGDTERKERAERWARK